MENCNHHNIKVISVPDNYEYYCTECNKRVNSMTATNAYILYEDNMETYYIDGGATIFGERLIVPE